jgi:drug/metabolite transporter (DMT)-like permease
VLWGLSPLMAGLLAALLPGEKSLTPLKICGTLFGIAGLALIFLQGDSLGGAHALAGLLALLLAVLIHNGVMLWLQQIGDDSPPLATTLGSLAVAVPLFALSWWLTDGQWPSELPGRTSGAIVYLGVVGSVIGFALYYYVIKHLHASRVSLITLITPVLALLLGNLLNGENISPRLWAGAGTILLGLLIHQWDGLRPLLQQGWARLRSA